MNVYGSFAEAYLASVVQVLEVGGSSDSTSDPLSVGSEFGSKVRRTREILCHKFCVLNPRDRSVISPVRQPSQAFSRANFIWTLTGGGDVNGISFYNSRGLLFAKNTAFYEAAFGARLFYPFQQLRHVERRLKNDPGSRRAMAMIYIAEDTQVDKLDTPCATYLHFLIREGRLVCICNMRSQSALMVLPYDFYLFSMIHEVLAVRIGVELGPMMYTSNSFHIYEDELNSANAFVQAGCVTAGPDHPICSADDSVLASLVSAEARIRLAACGERASGVILDQYWEKFLDPIREFCLAQERK